jgi:hypothetical protein
MVYSRGFSEAVARRELGMREVGARGENSPFSGSAMPSFALLSGRRPNSRVVLLLAAAVGALVLLFGIGAVSLALAGGTPALADETDDATVTGGNLVVTGLAHNTGKGDASGVVITVRVGLGGGITTSTNVGAIPAGGSAPYKVSVDLGSSSTSGNIPYSAKSSWDEPALDIDGDHYASSIVNGHEMVDHIGSVRNTGKSAAPNAVVLFQLASDKDGKNVLGHASQNVGTVAPGKAAAYKVSIDLGTNPSDSWYAFYDVTYDAPSVALEQTASQTLGGKVTISGHLRNTGRTDADRVSITKTVADATGQSLAKGQVAVGRVRSGTRVAYKVVIDLSGVSRGDITRQVTTADWYQTRFFIWREHQRGTIATTSTS